VLVQTDVEGGSYELYAVPKDAAGREVAPVGGTHIFCYRQFCAAALAAAAAAG
jgi:hypothetical protein